MSGRIKKNAAEVYSTGLQLELLMMKSEKGLLPISRTDEGIICLIAKPQTPKEWKYLPYNSTWLCEITQVFETKIIVKPIQQTISAEQNDLILKEKLKSIATKKPVRPEKDKATFPFQSKNEQRKGSHQ